MSELENRRLLSAAVLCRNSDRLWQNKLHKPVTRM